MTLVSICQQIEMNPYTFRTRTVVDEVQKWGIDHICSNRDETRDEDGHYPLLSLLYRSGIELSSASEQEIEKNYNCLLGLANAWLASKEEFLATCLNQTQTADLAGIKCFPLFLQKLVEEENIKLREKFFVYVVLQGNRLEPFVKFPYTIKQLMGAYLMTSKIGFINKQWPRIEVIKSEERLTLPCKERDKVHWLDISNPHATTIFNKKEYTSEGIIRVFRDKEIQCGELELWCDGIRYWKSHKIPVDPQIPLMQQLPVIKSLNCDEVKTYLDLQDDRLFVDTQMYFVILEGTHLSKYINEEKIELLNAHLSYMLIYPNEDETFNLTTVGFTSDIFPRNSFDYSILACTAVDGTLKSPDDNIFHWDREKGRLIFCVDRAGYEKFTEKLAAEFAEDVRNALYFQYGSYNCADWAVQMLDALGYSAMEEIKKGLQMSFFDFCFEGSSKYVFSILATLPPSWLRSFCHGMTTCVLANSRFRSRREFLKVNTGRSYEAGKRFGDKEGVIFHPAKLIFLSNKGVLPKYLDLRPGHQVVKLNIPHSLTVRSESVSLFVACCVSIALYVTTCMPYDG